MKNIINLLFLLLLTLSAFAQQSLFLGKPTIFAPNEIGNYPNTPFLYKIPVTGERPITISINNLPEGLVFNANTNIITGNIKNAGSKTITIKATNKQGSTSKDVTLVFGDKLCLTPPLGWNSWNVYAQNVSEDIILKVADEMQKNGMQDVGYEYINLDDFWHADHREADGRPKADSLKFPHGIKWLADHLHNKGFKLGIYSCAGNKTCGERFGSYGYEEIDAKQYAEWGIDLLKYDYCFVPKGKAIAIPRFIKMGTALRNSGRSIVYSVCEWGKNEPWLWADSAHAHYYRTTDDIFDRWNGVSFGYEGVFSIVNQNEKLVNYAKPGHWNDPDMLLVANYGNGIATGKRKRFKGLSDTQYGSHFAMWCFMNAPLLSSADPAKLNKPSLNLLLDSTLLSIQQDVSNKQAALLSKKQGIYVFKKELANNKTAFLIVNKKSRQKQVVLSKWIKNTPFVNQPKFINTDKTSITLPGGDYSILLQ